MGFAVLENNDTLGDGLQRVSNRDLQRGTIFQVSLALQKLGNFTSCCSCQLFLSEANLNEDGARFWFFSGAIYENAPFIWQGHMIIEGWEKVVMRSIGSGGHYIKCIVNIEYKPL